MQTRHGDSQGTEQSSIMREMNDSTKEKVIYLIVFVNDTCNF